MKIFLENSASLKRSESVTIRTRVSFFYAHETCLLHEPVWYSIAHTLCPCHLTEGDNINSEESVHSISNTKTLTHVEQQEIA